MHQKLRARELATVMATETMMTVMVMAQLAATALTRHESMQRSWLQKVSICAKIEESKIETYLCRLGHPPVLPSVCTESLYSAVNAEDSNLKLQTSAKHKKSKRLTWDTITRCGHYGDLERESKG